MYFKDSFQLFLLMPMIVLQLIQCGSGYTTSEENRALEKFKAIIETDLLYQDYMQTNEYLMRWLRVNKLNENDAYKMLKKSIQWRKANNIDHVLDSSGNMNSKCDKILPTYTSNSIDKYGRPIAFYRLADWKLRTLAIAGRLPYFRYCLVSLLERMTTKIREQPNSNVTQSLFVVDLFGMNAREHTCFACINTMVGMVKDYENHYPLTIGTALLLNSPEILHGLLRAMKSRISQDSRELLQIYGYRDWQDEILKYVDKDQIPKAYGGSKV